MRLLPAPNYIAIRINKEVQKEKKEKHGSLYIVTDSKNESRNVQSGEIVALGANIKDIFPQAEIGHTLLCHWMVESVQKDNKFYEDETYNYYVATASEHNGKANESYGVWDGENIIPNSPYIFLYPKEDKREVKQTDSGLFIFENWAETRTETESKMAAINAEIQSLAKTKRSDQLMGGIQRKEAELAELSNKINRTCIEFYKVAAINPDFNEIVEEAFGKKLDVGENAGMLNAACKTTIEFDGISYIVALSKHFHLPEYWALEAIKNKREISKN